jgi:membrane protein required for colicin V production
LAAFVVNLIIILILSQLGGFLVTKFMDASPLGVPNRIFGAFFSVIKTLLILSVVIVILEKVNDKTRFISKEKTQNSFLYKPLSIFAPTIYPYFETGITKTLEFNRQEKIIE